MYTGVDLGFSEEGAGTKHSSGCLKQGAWVHSPSEVIGCLVFNYINYQNLRFRA